MNLKLGILLFLMCCITAIKCWVELDIAGNDLSKPHPKFIEPKEAADCDDDNEGKKQGNPHVNVRSGVSGNHKRKHKRRSRKPQMRAAFNDVQKYAKQLDKGKDPNAEDDCVVTSPKTVTEVQQRPQLRMVDSEKIEEKEKVETTNLETTECTEIIDMEPKTSVKIETYTVPYTITDVKYKTMTRKVVYIQRRRKIKRTLSKPILVIKRKLVKDKQTFERIIPKIIETREIINKPKVEYKIIEGPMEEMEGPKSVENAECDDEVTAPMVPIESAPNSPILADGPHPAEHGPPPEQEEPIPVPIEDSGSDTGSDTGSSSGINVGFDFVHALGQGISAAFHADRHNDEVVRPNVRSRFGQKPNSRSGMFEHATTCPPGAIGGGGGEPGSSINAGQSLNAYGQPVLSFQD